MKKADYYYGVESEQFSFCRIPKIFFKDPQLKTLSTDAKLLYGLMLDRMSLSIKSGWLDENSRVYIYYTVAQIMEDLGCKREKCTKIVTELSKMGLIEKKRQGLGKPDKIYVKNFMTMLAPEEKQEIRKTNFQRSENRNSCDSIPESTAIRFSNGINTEITKIKDINKTDLIRSDPAGYVNMESIQANIDYNGLLIKYPQEKRMINELCAIICEVLNCQSKTIYIAQNERLTVDVKKRLEMIDYECMEYIIECIKDNTKEVKNIKKYLLAVLFNAPVTMDSFYRAKVQHNMPQLVEMKRG